MHGAMTRTGRLTQIMAAVLILVATGAAWGDRTREARIEGEIDELRDEIDDLREELADIRDEIRDLEHEARQVTRDIREVQTMLAEAEAASSQAKQVVEAAEARVDEADAKIAAAEANVDVVTDALRREFLRSDAFTDAQRALTGALRTRDETKASIVARVRETRAYQAAIEAVEEAEEAFAKLRGELGATPEENADVNQQALLEAATHLLDKRRVTSRMEDHALTISAAFAQSEQDVLTAKAGLREVINTFERNLPQHPRRVAAVEAVNREKQAAVPLREELAAAEEAFEPFRRHLEGLAANLAALQADLVRITERVQYRAGEYEYKERLKYRKERRKDLLYAELRRERRRTAEEEEDDD